MTQRDRPIRKFNPGTFQSDEEVIEQFVVRERELDIVLEVLRGNIDSPSCQHVLVVAPRGRGKTMLLARVAAEVNTEDELSESYLPIRFMEESHEIFSFADFWLDTLFYLARESARNDPVLAEELRQTHDDLTNRWQDEALADRAQAAALEAADRLGRKLVLMVENLQALCGNVDKDFGWKLRAVLQSEPQVMLLATATSRFEGLDDAEQPFFELFRIVGLEPLNTEECGRLWQVVSGDAVSKREIRPLEILTGGSPRLLVIVAGFAQHRSLAQLMEELVELIDEHTEYFRGHLGVLAKGERRVYIAVIDLWQPSSTGEIAARARMDVRTVSTLLGRLAIRGAVIVMGSGKKRMYFAAERLYTIYYKLRRERDEAAVVANLIHFMTVFFSRDEFVEMSRDLIADATKLPEIREGIERVIADQPLLSNLFQSIVRPSIDRTSSPSTAVDIETEIKQVEEISTALEEGAYEKVIETVDHALITWREHWSEVPESLIAQTYLNKAVAHSGLGELAAAITAFEEVITRIGASEDLELQDSVALAKFGKGVAHGERGELAAAIASYDQVITRFGTSDESDLKIRVAWALSKKGDVHEERGELAAAIVSYDEVVTRFGTSGELDLKIRVAWALLKKGDVYRERGELAAAIVSYDEVIINFGTSDKSDLQVPVAWAFLNKGDVQEGGGKLEEAIVSYDEVITRVAASNESDLQVPVAWALVKKGSVQWERGVVPAAVASYDEVITRFANSDKSDLQVPVAWTFSKKGEVHERRDEFEAAISAYDEVITRLGTSDESELRAPAVWALSKKGDVEMQRGEFQSAIALYNEVVTRLGTTDESYLQKWITEILSKKSMGQIKVGEIKEALNTCGELELRLGKLDEDLKNEFTLRARCVRALALLFQKKHRDSMDMFRSAYSLFEPVKETMMYEIQRIVPDLVAAGASARDLADVLLSDKKKSNALGPLIVALLQHTGETVRAPLEVLEVAEDIRQRIEKAGTKGTN